MKKIIVFFSIFFSTISLFAQKVKMVIPYEIVGDKMVVEVKINGTPQKAIFDTGGRTTITKKLFDELNLSITDSLEVTDVNSHKAFYKMAKIESILLKDNEVSFKGFPALLAPEPSPFECFGVEVLLGSELLGGTILEIDGKAKTISILSAEVPSKASLRTMHGFIKNGTTPIIGLNIGGQSIAVLFDTGYGGFLNLKTSDYQTLALQPISEAFAEGSVGMGGKAETALSYRVKIDNISVGGAKFKNIISETETPPYTLLGMKLLDYGKVIIDYSRARFFFEAYEKENDLMRSVNDFSLMVKDGKLVISTVWVSMRGIVQNGDIVTHINGKPVEEQYDFCESIIKGIHGLKEKKKTILTVETKNGLRKITLINNK